MNPTPVHAGREFTAAELDTVSGGKGLFTSRKELQNDDKLGNFEIQTLMSTFNQAETLASSVLKKLSDTASAVIGKI